MPTLPNAISCGCRGAIALAVLKMLEEDLNFCFVYTKYQRDDAYQLNAGAGGGGPAIFRPFTTRMKRAGMLRTLEGQVWTRTTNCFDRHDLPMHACAHM